MDRAVGLCMGRACCALLVVNYAACEAGETTQPVPENTGDLSDAVQSPMDDASGDTVSLPEATGPRERRTRRT